jgi:transposase
VARSTVADIVSRAEMAGLTWEKVSEMSEVALEEQLYVVLGDPPSVKAEPDYHWIHQQLRLHKDLTTLLLWEEYREQYPDGWSRSRFYHYYQQWRKKLDLVMRQEHRGGEKLFIDYCKGPKLIDPETGEEKQVELFVCVWGASNYTYAEASYSEQLPHWIASHVRAFSYFGCVPAILVPDNLKSGVHTACRYEPGINRTYSEMAAHYQTTIIPARPAHPRDKAKVEVGVQVVKRWILAALRNRRFYSLAELNVAIAQLLERLNNRLLKKMKKSRKELFELFDRPNALPLPIQPYEYGEWKRVRINPDYHIDVEGHYYSVPYQLVRETIDLRITATTVEALYKGARVAVHQRSSQKGGMTTCKEHMPPAHRAYSEWTPDRIQQAALEMGNSVGQLVHLIFERTHQRELAARSALGILRLGNRFGVERLQAAATRALHYGACSFTSIKNILQLRLDQQGDAEPSQQPSLPPHENIRGSSYYQND